MSSNLNTPWTLDFERDGTEDIAVIRDADGEQLVTSRPFWLPEGDDPEPPTLAAMRLMHAAPKLLEALLSVRDAGYIDFAYQPTVELVDAAIAEATVQHKNTQA